LQKKIEKSKHIDYIKYAKGIRKLIAAFESRFTNLDKNKEIFKIYSSPFHTDEELGPQNTFK